MKKIKYKDLKEDFFYYQNFEGIDKVSEIVNYVKIHGDEAVIKYSKQFGDGNLEKPELTNE